MNVQAAYGVHLKSAIPLPGLPAASDRGTETISIVLDHPSDPTGARAHTAPDVEVPHDGRPLTFTVNGGLDIRWGAALAFHLSVADSVIRCERGPEGTLNELQDWLLHYALPLLLQMQRRLRFLHGGAVRIDAQAVGFLAPSRGGKSTLVEYFLQHGHGFLTDDKLGVMPGERGFVAVPGVPFYRRGDAKAVWRHVSDFVERALPLHTLYLLAPAAATVSPAITEVPAQEAAFALACRCELQLPAPVRQRLRFPPLATERFHDGAALASAVRVCRLRVPRDRSRLPEVYETIMADVAGTT